jgi:putative SOS response-associated peptidase YedK
MCGRFSLTQLENLAALFRLTYMACELTQRYNIAPSQSSPVILNDQPDTLQGVQWGLIPSWAKESKIGYSMINARAETVDQKPSFRGPFKRQRCLVLADGFYEWQKTTLGKQPFRITLKDETPFAFAGIWDSWDDPKRKKTLKTFSIITTSANELMESIHERMPVILPKKDEAAWLDSKLPLKPYAPRSMNAYPISKLVNSPANDVPAVLEPLNKK